MRNYNSIRTLTRLAKPGLQDTIYVEKSKLDESLHSKIPVICLLGWTGARDSHLKKYSQIYSHLGYHTVRFSPSNKLLLFQSKKHPKHALDLVDQLSKHFGKNPLMFHFFSNGGLVIFYQHILRNLNKPEYNVVKQNEKGQIFDSCPGLTQNHQELHQSISRILESDIKLKIARTSMAFTISALFTLWLTQTDNFIKKGINKAVRDSRCLPSLFLLSNADKFCDPDDIKKNIEIKMKNSSSIRKDYYMKIKVYDDADHVQLYSKYPDDYLKHIKEHLKVCNLEI